MLIEKDNAITQKFTLNQNTGDLFLAHCATSFAELNHFHLR